MNLAVAALAEPGTIFAEKYRVESVLGSGGMGIILAARHVQIDQRVAIKVMSETPDDPERLARFTREARVAARIQSDHVVRIIDFGTDRHGLPFIVMEHLTGHDLGEVVSKEGPLSIEEAIDYILQACEGIAEAHFHGIIHRDIKPANLFITRTKSGAKLLKVLDFGASKLTGKSSFAKGDPLKTDAFAVIGSPSYMAPEQLREGLDLDARADVYSVGATLYELLTGQALFSGDSISRIFSKVLWDPPPPLRALRSDAPEELETTILKCLEKQPADRYASIKDLAVALGPLASERSRALLAQIEQTGLPAASIAPPPAAGGTTLTSAAITPPKLPSPASLSSSETKSPLAKSTPSAVQIVTPAPVVTPARVDAASLPDPDLESAVTAPQIPDSVLNPHPEELHSTRTRSAIAVGAGLAALLIAGIAILVARTPRAASEAAPTTAQVVAAPPPSAPPSAAFPVTTALAPIQQPEPALSTSPTKAPSAPPHANEPTRVAHGGRGTAAQASAPIVATTTAAPSATPRPPASSGSLTDFGTRK